jgi:hypothetical protein
MNTINKIAIIETLKNNLSHQFKEWYPTERFNDWKIEQIDVELSTLANIIVHPPKDNPNVRIVFLEDAKFICEYALTLGFDEFSILEFRTLLAEINIDKKNYKTAMELINLNKLIMEEDIDIFKFELKTVYILEWQIYKQSNELLKMKEIESKINSL